MKSLLHHCLDSCCHCLKCTLTRGPAPAATMVGLVVAINLANKRLFNGISGWRVVYFAAAVLGLLTVLVSALFISEPRHGQRAAGQDPTVGSSTDHGADPSARACARRPRLSCRAAAGFSREFGSHVLAVARTPSFIVILVVRKSVNVRACCLPHLWLELVAQPILQCSTECLLSSGAHLQLDARGKRVPGVVPAGAPHLL